MFFEIILFKIKDLYSIYVEVHKRNNTNNMVGVGDKFYEGAL